MTTTTLSGPVAERRWRNVRTGARVVLAPDGRLLYAPGLAGRFRLARPRATEAEAAAFVAGLGQKGFVRVNVGPRGRGKPAGAGARDGFERLERRKGDGALMLVKDNRNEHRQVIVAIRHGWIIEAAPVASDADREARVAAYAAQVGEDGKGRIDYQAGIRASVGRAS